MTDLSITRIIVTVDDQHLTRIQMVVTELQSAGMKIEQVMSTVGIISGEVSLSRLSILQTIPGVLNVEPDEPMTAI